MSFVELIRLAQLNEAGGTFIGHDGRELAVFLLDEPRSVAVIDNACPHAGGNLAAGAVENGTVTCPWHQWNFDLDTGLCTQSDRARVRRYPAEIRDGSLWVDLDATPERPVE